MENKPLINYKINGIMEIGLLRLCPHDCYRRKFINMKRSHIFWLALRGYDDVCVTSCGSGTEGNGPVIPYFVSDFQL